MLNVNNRKHLLLGAVIAGLISGILTAVVSYYLEPVMLDRPVSLLRSVIFGTFNALSVAGNFYFLFPRTLRWINGRSQV